MTETTLADRCLEFDDAELARELFGPGNDNLTALTAVSGVDVQTRGTTVFVRGQNKDRVDLASNLLCQLYGLLKAGYPLYGGDLQNAWGILLREPGAELKKIFQDVVFSASPKKTVAPKTLSQRAYVEAIRRNDMVFGVGPAGTGKTYLAVALALNSLLAKEVKRLILVRPAVEAGEKLGFLPGDLVEKINPYLRPMYDALHDMMDFRKVSDMLETGIIEIAPLAFMRGRTLNDAFIILDEAQNTTPEQMKMFLTRLGFGSKAVITGDITQIDLPFQGFTSSAAPGKSQRSGLVRAIDILKNVKGVSFVHFHDADVIRHPLVARIVKAYDKQTQE